MGDIIKRERERKSFFFSFFLFFTYSFISPRSKFFLRHHSPFFLPFFSWLKFHNSTRRRRRRAVKMLEGWKGYSKKDIREIPFLSDLYFLTATQIEFKYKELELWKLDLEEQRHAALFSKHHWLKVKWLITGHEKEQRWTHERSATGINRLGCLGHCFPSQRVKRKTYILQPFSNFSHRTTRRRRRRRPLPKKRKESNSSPLDEALVELWLRTTVV